MGEAALLSVAVKTQQVRLMDVFLLGPFMVYAATLIPSRHKEVKFILAASGVLTSLYNGKNYLEVQKALSGKP
tara:strand:- start:395 stop:613 length:219 start_codon:yes stop_codon:yes gene_type:complete